MDHSIIENSALLQGIGFAIIHSLWQMGLLWLFYCAVTRFVKLNAATKYVLAIALPLAGVVLFITTALQYPGHQSAVNNGVFSHNISGEALLSIWQSLRGAIITILHTVAPYCSLAYLLVALYWLLTMIAGIMRLKSVIYNPAGKVPLALRIFTQQHAAMLGILQPVLLLQSEQVKVPFTFGFLKPVIVLPICCITSLNTAQIEAILLHELTHIRRHDYLFNIILSIAESVLFFNPFMRQLATQARIERENACDDQVLQFRYNAGEYVKALLSIAKYGSLVPFTLTANGSNKHHLYQRVLRMINPEQVRSYPNSTSIKRYTILFLAALFASFQIWDAGTPTRVFSTEIPARSHVVHKLINPTAYAAKNQVDLKGAFAMLRTQLPLVQLTEQSIKIATTPAISLSNIDQQIARLHLEQGSNEHIEPVTTIQSLQPVTSAIAAAYNHPHTLEEIAELSTDDQKLTNQFKKVRQQKLEQLFQQLDENRSLSNADWAKLATLLASFSSELQELKSRVNTIPQATFAREQETLREDETLFIAYDEKTGKLAFTTQQIEMPEKEVSNISLQSKNIEGIAKVKTGQEDFIQMQQAEVELNRKRLGENEQKVMLLRKSATDPVSRKRVISL